MWIFFFLLPFLFDESISLKQCYNQEDRCKLRENRDLKFVLTKNAFVVDCKLSDLTKRTEYKREKCFQSIVINKNSSINLKFNYLFVLIDEKCTIQYNLFSHVLSLIQNWPNALVREIKLNRVDGFNIQAPLRINLTNASFRLSLYNSKLEFFDNLRNPVRKCSEFEKLEIANKSFLLNFVDNSKLTSSSSKLLSYRVLNFQSVEYKRPVCELVFVNIRLDELYLKNMIQSFYHNNMLRFLNHTESMNSTNINVLVIESFNIDLDVRIINPNVFRNMRILRVLENLNSIQVDLFASFINVRNLYLDWTCFGHLIKK